MAWEVIAAPKRRGGTSVNKSNCIVIAHEKACGKKSGMALSFRIGSDVAKQLRWQKGDRVSFVRDGDAIGMRRLCSKATDGWILSGATNGTSLRFKIVNDDMMKVLIPGDLVDPLISGDVVVIGEAKSKIK
jgi:hypothetical protein